ncbi:MAG TPA: vWA domain-containing protein [Polyangiaceae bacterium]|jgi:hypothetical protein
MTGVSQVAWTLALTALTAVACGARTGLLVPLDTEDGGLTGPACMGTEIPLDTNAPNLYFVIDGSTSMQEDSKWTNVRSSVAALITALGPRASFGAAVFPTQGGDACTTGSEVMPVQPGDSQGTAAAAFLAATSVNPTGGTPTAATLRALVPELSSFPQLTFAILATDGGPNCDPTLSCGVAACTSNMDGAPGCPVGGPPNCCDPVTGAGGLACLDGTATVQAVSALRAAGVETFVMGIPGSAPYAAVLDELALAGGGARANEPYYYQVDSSDTGALGDALGEIAAQAVASCTFTLTQTPGDPGLVNVYVDGSVVPQSGANGWSLAGTKVTLEGSTCGGVEAGTALSVHVEQGCPTVM